VICDFEWVGMGVIEWVIDWGWGRGGRLWLQLSG